MYFKMLDDAAYFAAASLDTEYFLYTVRFETRLTRPVTTELLHAEGLVTLRPEMDEEGNFLGGIKAVSRLYAEGKLVAEGTGEFRRGGKKLTDIESYTQ
jgi:acyl-coenzyme A thioesterase PaaI-like protein